MTFDEIAKLVEHFYQAWADADRDLIEEMVAETFSFTSPYDDHIDREEYFRRCWPNAGHQQGKFQLIHIVSDGGDGAIVLYEAQMDSGASLRNMEYLIFAGGQLISVEVYFGLAPGETPTTPVAWNAARQGQATRAH